MASSSKVTFKLDVLKEQALESLDSRIKIQQDRLAGSTDPATQEDLVRQWRAAQEAKISDIFSRLGEDGVSDYHLSKFKLDPIPEFDNYDVRNTQREIDRLLAVRSKVVAKANSLVADADGNIALTKTQLSEFFGL